MTLTKFFEELAKGTARYSATLNMMNNNGMDNTRHEIIKPVYYRPVLSGVRLMLRYM